MLFKKNYNCIRSVKEKDSFYKNLGASCINIERPVTYINGVIKCVQKLKGVKLLILMAFCESIVCGKNKLFIYIALFFNACLNFSYLPPKFEA